MRKRILTGVLSIIMAVTLIPTTAFAKESRLKEQSLQISTQAEGQKASNVISSGATSSIWIEAGGTYTLEAGEYDTDKGNIIVNTTEPVMLKVNGDIKYKGSNALIVVENACENLTIDGSRYEIRSVSEQGGGCALNNASKANVVLKGGRYV